MRRWVLAGILARRLRPDDELGRYGGEEFAAVLPETSLGGALKIAEDLRGLVEQHRFIVEGEQIRVTVSIGAAARCSWAEPGIVPIWRCRPPASPCDIPRPLRLWRPFF